MKSYYFRIKFEKRTEYVIEYMEKLFNNYKKLFNLAESNLVYGNFCRKLNNLRRYEKLT